jgi:hypothetical protein
MRLQTGACCPFQLCCWQALLQKRAVAHPEHLLPLRDTSSSSLCSYTLLQPGLQHLLGQLLSLLPLELTLLLLLLLVWRRFVHASATTSTDCAAAAPRLLLCCALLLLLLLLFLLLHLLLTAASAITPVCVWL